MNHTILLTFDIEDWFQVENFKQYIPFSSWSNYELRVDQNTHRILDLLDSIKLNNSTNSTNLSREMQSIFHWDSIPHSPNNSLTHSLNNLMTQVTQ